MIGRDREQPELDRRQITRMTTSSAPLEFCCIGGFHSQSLELAESGVEKSRCRYSGILHSCTTRYTLAPGIYRKHRKKEPLSRRPLSLFYGHFPLKETLSERHTYVDSSSPNWAVRFCPGFVTHYTKFLKTAKTIKSRRDPTQGTTYYTEAQNQEV